jgi:hypothetical protein
VAISRAAKKTLAALKTLGWHSFVRFIGCAGEVDSFTMVQHAQVRNFFG